MAEYKFRDESLDIDERVKALIAELTLEEKLHFIHTKQRAIPRLDIGEFGIGAEVARGLVCRDGRGGEWPTTVFPEPFGMAAMFDPDLMRAIGEVTGTEVNIRYHQGKASKCVWGPTVDMERDPRWGRNEESYGEDPYLTGTMAAAYVRGMYGVNEKYARVIPTLKHFYANNHEEDRSHDNAVIPTRLKRDYYLKAFETPVRECKGMSLMTSYNEINGVEGLCNPELKRICKEEWGLLFSVTDGGDFIQNVRSHRRDKTHVDAIAKVYSNGGADVMTDNEELVNDAAREALSRGLITEQHIDDAIFGVLKARFLLGEFDENCPYNNYNEEQLCSPEHLAVAEKAAEESVILLKNSHLVLPLSKREKLTVIGYFADHNYRDWYTGLSTTNATILDKIVATIGKENVVYEPANDIVAFRSDSTGFYLSVDEEGNIRCDSPMINENCLFELYRWGDGAVSLKSRINGKFLQENGALRCVSDEPFGWFVKELFRLEQNDKVCVLRNWQDRFVFINERSELEVTTSLRAPKSAKLNMEIFSSGVDRVRRAVTESHNTVVFCGNNPMINARETKDRKHLDLPDAQKRILDTVVSIKPDAVLYLVSGYPYAFDADKFSTIMHITHAGPAIGNAVAKTLFGDVSPAGRCPMTWYASDSELCDIKDYNIIRTRSTYQYYDGEPLFSFGHGLSYTAFRYGTARTDKSIYQRGEKVKVVLDVTNVGGMGADEVVQLYIAPPELPITLPEKQLKAFARVHIPKDEAATVVLHFNIDDLAYWNVNTNSFDVFGGQYKLLIGTSSTDIRRTAEIEVIGSDYKGLDVSCDVAAVNSIDYVGVVFDADEKLEEYALINDWQSKLNFEYCCMKDYRHFEAVVSNPGVTAKLTVTNTDTGTVVAECEVPPTGSFTEFITVSCAAKPVSGTYNLCFTAGDMLCIKSFRFY